MEIIPTKKIVNRDGIKAVKNGQKANKYSTIPNQKKPDWIRVKATFDKNFKAVKAQLMAKDLILYARRVCAQICQSAGQRAPQHLCSWALFAHVPVSFVL